MHQAVDKPLDKVYANLKRRSARFLHTLKGSEVLEQYGYTVICAADGQEGLDICKGFAGRIDLIITDVVMPRMSGRELAESVASVRPDTRILYMSGFTDDAIVRHGMLDEDFPFIQKPFSPELLASKTRELLDA